MIGYIIYDWVYHKVWLGLSWYMIGYIMNAVYIWNRRWKNPPPLNKTSKKQSNINYTCKTMNFLFSKHTYHAFIFIKESFIFMKCAFRLTLFCEFSHLSVFLFAAFGFGCRLICMIAMTTITTTSSRITIPAIMPTDIPVSQMFSNYIHGKVVN